VSDALPDGERETGAPLNTALITPMNANTQSIEVEHENTTIEVPAEYADYGEVTAIFEFEGELRAQFDVGGGRVREALVHTDGTFGDVEATYEPTGTLEEVGANVLYDGR